MSSYTATLPATTNGTLSISGASSTTVTPGGAVTGDHTCSKAGNASPHVDVTATPNSGYAIGSWSASGYTAPGSVLTTDPSGTPATVNLTLTSNTNVAAPTFVEYHAVTVTVSGSGAASVTASDGAHDTTSSITVYVEHGSGVTISETADSGHQHVSTDDASNITADATITVTFEPVVLTAAEDDDFLSQSDTATRKHLLLKVPDYELATGTTYLSPKDTYIQVGDATEVSSPSATTNGNDLLPWAYDQPSRVTAASNISFLDDVRNRGSEGAAGGTFSGAGATPPDETAAREEEMVGGSGTGSVAKAYSAAGAVSGSGDTNMNATVSANIPDYVGWRDHTDGHRITTTRGDKIEVIGGNYKIVSLGRGTGVASYEMSGGIIVDAMEAPGNQTSVTWRTAPSTGQSGWKVVSQTVGGHEVSRFHGTQRDEFYGDKQISVVGAPKDSGSFRTTGFSLGANSDGTDDYVSGQGSFATNITSEAYPTKWDLRGGVAPQLQQPDIYESTWANSVTSYTYIEEQNKEEVHYNSGHISHTYIKVGCDHEEHFWGDHKEYFMGAKTEFFFGASTTIGLANRFELFCGLEEQINLIGSIEFALGFKIEATIPQKLQFDLTAQKIKMSDLDVSLQKAVTHAQASRAAAMTNDAYAASNHVGVVRNRRNAFSAL